MPNPPKQKKQPKTPLLSIRISPERKRQIKEWRLHHGDITQQQFVEEAVAMALGETKPPKIAPKMRGTDVIGLAYNLHIPDDREWIEFVVFILNTDNQTAQHGLKSNIIGFLAMLDDDSGVDDGEEHFSPRNFSILLDRARLLYAKQKSRRKADRKTPNPDPQTTL
jgi:hypothetical protein